LSNTINATQKRTARAARAIPIHIVRCGAHFIVTTSGEAEGGSNQPLKPPEICRGTPRLVDPAWASQPSLKPSPRINQHPAGQLLTVAVRVVRVRSTTTVGGGAGPTAAASTDGS